MVRPLETTFDMMAKIHRYIREFKILEFNVAGPFGRSFIMNINIFDEFRFRPEITLREYLNETFESHIISVLPRNATQNGPDSLNRNEIESIGY